MNKIIDIKKETIKALTNDALDCNTKLKPYVESVLDVVSTDERIRKAVKKKVGVS